MSRMKRLAGALLLTAVILADAADLGPTPGGLETSQASLNQIMKLDFVKGHKVYDANGLFKGCEKGGSGCLMITTSSLTEFTISSEGIHVQ